MIFNSDSTGDLSSKVRESSTNSQDTPKKTRSSRSTGKKPRSRLTRPQLDAVASKLVEKSQQVQNKTRDFASVDHLSSDAAAMFVDNELSKGAMHRARLHLVHCAECREEINNQRHTVDFVRTECKSDSVTAPTDLKAKLMSLANECSPGPGAEDVAIQRPESFVAKVESVVRAVRRTQGR